MSPKNLGEKSFSKIPEVVRTPAQSHAHSGAEVGEQAGLRVGEMWEWGYVGCEGIREGFIVS